MAFEFESVWLEVANNFGSQPLSWPKFLRWVTGNVMGHCTMDPFNLIVAVHEQLVVVDDCCCSSPIHTPDRRPTFPNIIC